MSKTIALNLFIELAKSWWTEISNWSFKVLVELAVVGINVFGRWLILNGCMIIVENLPNPAPKWNVIELTRKTNRSWQNLSFPMFKA